MQVVIRVDASVQIGSGHVMRCLTLANRLKSRSIQVTFICRELKGHLCDLIEAQGFEVIRLPAMVTPRVYVPDLTHAHWLEAEWEEDAKQCGEYLERIVPDWLVVDHYALDKRWEVRMRPWVKQIMVIDDLADRQHDCELLLDQNLYEHADERYRKLVPDTCITLIGPQYALLREEFYEFRRLKNVRHGDVKRIFVFFGGSDRENMTAQAIQAINSLKMDHIQTDVVVGASNPHKNMIEQVCQESPNIHFYCQVNQMAKLMSEADLAIGAGGSATWERCVLGLPTVMIVTADNQREIARAAEKHGAALCIGNPNTVDSSTIAECLRNLLGNPSEVRKMSLNSLRLMGDHGINECDVVIDMILSCGLG